MSSIIEKKEEHILTRAQFEKLKTDGQLVIGSIYKIKDDPTAQALIDGIFTSKKAEQDSNGNIIEYTYRRIDDSYSIADIDNQFISKLQNYYTKQEIYTKSEVEVLLNAIPKFGVQVVTTLPTENISTSDIYLVAQTTNGDDYYNEYMYINNRWELLGSTRIDLSNYYTVAEVMAIANLKVDKTDVANQIYGTNTIGEPETYTVTSEANIDTIVQRTSSGTIKANDATTDNEVTSRAQVQALIATETLNRTEADTAIRNLIPTNISQLNNDLSYITNSQLATVAKTGSYNDLLNKPNLSEIESRLSILENSTPEIDTDGLATQEALNNVINNTTQIVGSKNNFMAGGAKEANGTGCISIGYNADTGFGGWNDGIAIGRKTIAYGGYDIAIGYNSGVTYSGVSNAITIGRNAKASESNVIQLGTGQNSNENTLQIYDDNIYNWNDHTLDVQNLHQNGNPVFGTLTDTITPDAWLHGETGQFYLNTDEKKLYICTAVDLNDETGERLHNWQEVGGNSSDNLSNYYTKDETDLMFTVADNTNLLLEAPIENSDNMGVLPNGDDSYQLAIEPGKTYEVKYTINGVELKYTSSCIEDGSYKVLGMKSNDDGSTGFVSTFIYNEKEYGLGFLVDGPYTMYLISEIEINTVPRDGTIPLTIISIKEVATKYALATDTYTKTEINNLINQNNFSGNYDDLTNKPEIPSIAGLATETYVNTKVAALVDSAPETLDTLAEVATAIQENETVVEALNSAIGNKANQEDLTALDNRLTIEENKTLKTFTLYQASAVNVHTESNDKVSVGNVILNVKYDGSSNIETYNLAHIDNVRELGNAHNKLVDRVASLETSMPTKLSDLTNDTEYVTKAEMEAAIAEAIKNLVTTEQLEAAITNNITDTLNTEV